MPRSSGMPGPEDSHPPIGAPRPLPHSANLRVHRLSDASATFFVTKSLRPRKPVLTLQLRGVISEAFVFAVQKERIYLRAFVVMPDHWHALLALREPWMLPKFMHAFMSYVGGKTKARLASRKASWQDGYYETHVKQRGSSSTLLVTLNRIRW